jgi:hypothetical protein
MKFTFSLALLFLSVKIFAGGIPKTMPDDFYVSYHSHLGYHPNYQVIDLSLHYCYISFQSAEMDEASSFSFTISKEELSSLYNVLYTLKAFTLKSKPTKYGDRGGEKIDYTIAGKRYTVNNSGNYFVAQKHKDHFIESIDLITAFADRHKH